MPYKDPNSAAAKASNKRRQEKYRGTAKSNARYKKFQTAHGRDRWYRYAHGTSEAAFEAQIAAQGGLCPIGMHPFGPRGNRGDSPCQDHDHESGENRAVLCHNHNIALGLFNDSTAEMQNAISYLNGYKKF